MSRAVTVSSASGTIVIRDAKIMFEPSSYDGTATAKKNLVLQVDDATIDIVHDWESPIDQGRLASALTQYGLRAKITDPKVWQDEEQTTMPATVKNRRVNAVLVLSGIWHTKKQDGLCLQVTDLEFLEDAAPQYPF